MGFYCLIVGLLFGSLMLTPTKGAKVLFDFTQTSDVNDWSELSDTVHDVGMSKAVLSLQKTQIFQRAVFFTLLNPKPNGGGFAGVQTRGKWDLREYNEIRIRCRGQGENSHYKVVLRHKNQSSNNDVVYEQLFDVPKSNTKFFNIVLPLNGFKAFRRGKVVKDAKPLDPEDVTMFGLQLYGGVYSSIKQSGVSALEIEKIEAIKDSE